MFGRVYRNDGKMIGFDSKGGTWLFARKEVDGVFISTYYPRCEDVLSVKQARKFANKIHDFCDVIEASRIVKGDKK